MSIPPITPPGDANSGLIDPVDFTKAEDILGPDGNVVWDNNKQYRTFLIDDSTPAPTTANENLWTQSKQLVKQGLYVVTDGIYQLRGYDISNMTIVQSENGIIVIDPLVSRECAAAALALYNKNIYSDPQTAPPAKAIIYTHSHIDHYGGVEGVLTPGVECQIIAPAGFMEHAVSENVYAGNAMNRRANYMYGDQIPRDPEHQIGTGLGMTTSSGTSTIIKPTDTIEKNGAMLVDGVNIVFQLTPGTEAPAEMNFHFPDHKALCIAENANQTMHNIQTLRGALVRDPHMWSKYLDETIQLFGAGTDVVFGSHNWPTWGAEYVREYLVSQRDMYAYLNDQTLRLLNDGLTGLEIAEVFKLPDSLTSKWYNHGFYGSISHNVKAVYNRYMGWFDGNPAHLWEWPPVEAGKFYLECMNGVDGVLDLAEGYITADPPNLRFAATLLSHAVFATDGSGEFDSTARSKLVEVLKKLGYAAECGPWRNFFLVGAYELEYGIRGPVLGTVSFDSMMALDLGELMDTMAIRLDGPGVPAADPIDPDSQPFNIEFLVMSESGVDPPITEDRIVLTLSNSALTNRRPVATPGDEVGLTCTLTHKQLVELVMGTMTLPDPRIISDGNTNLWSTITSHLLPLDPAFAIVTAEVEEVGK
jgi:alkyl sulfatase BDS1-like metallo-beta-lactamase superfamily hydrolase